MFKSDGGAEAIGSIKFPTTFRSLLQVSMMAGHSTQIPKSTDAQVDPGVTVTVTFQAMGQLQPSWQWQRQSRTMGLQQPKHKQLQEKSSERALHAQLLSVCQPWASMLSSPQKPQQHLSLFCCWQAACCGM
jgi:hypothetical protein